MNLRQEDWRNCAGCGMRQTTLQYAQKGYRGPETPVNRKNESLRLGKFLRPLLVHARQGAKGMPLHASRSRIATMPHLHVIPAPPLSRFVELLWYYEEPPKPHAKERLMPDGCVSFIINLAEDETRLYDPDDVSKVTRFSPCCLSGPQTKCFVIDTDEQTCVLGASFRAGGAVPFLGLPSDELHNQHLNLEDLWGFRARELRERLLAAPNPRAKLRMLELALLERAAGIFDGQPVVEYAVQNFLARPATVKIAEVSDKTGFSARRFIELFKLHVGMTPKLFCRVRRFQRVLTCITSGQPVNWTGVALDGGYFDQAHFIHDFRAFSGINPSKYLVDYKDFPRHPNHLPLV